MNPRALLRSEDHSLTCSPIGLQVVDSFLSTTPVAGYRARIDVRDGASWLETILRPTRTPSGILTLPGLGRCPLVTANLQPRLYRLRIEADEYVPNYRRAADGFEFLVPPYDDAHAPAVPAVNIGILELHPSSSYSYPGGVRVIRGRVVETSGTPVRDAVLEFQGLDRSMTDERGEFAFGLRRAAATGQITIDVLHDRTARAQSFTLQLPAALRSNQVLTLV